MTPAEIQALHDAGMTQRELARLLGKSTSMISPYLKSIGIVTRKRGGDWTRRPHNIRTPSQARNAAESRANGDTAVRARWTPRRPCPWGVTCKDEPSKPLPCTLVDAGCDPVACVGSRMAEGRVSVASSFGREVVVQGGMR